jgi:hypothetical protein
VDVLVHDAFLARWRVLPACMPFFTQPCAVVDVVYAHAWAGRTERPLVSEEAVELPRAAGRRAPAGEP